MANQGWYSEDQEQEFRQAARKEVLAALSKAEKGPMLPMEEMFDDVYSEMPRHL